LEHTFSVEMKSNNIKNISISNEAHDGVIFEGNLGEMRRIILAEGNVLEIEGVNGVLRVDLTEQELSDVLEVHRRSSLSSEVGSYKSAT
jgi:hypothetical protein